MDKLKRTERAPKIPFLQILEEHDISIDLLAHFTQVSPWTVVKMASHRPVDRITVQRVLADVSILARRPFSLENVEVATYDPEADPDAGQEDTICLGRRPTFRQLLAFHAIQPPLLAEMTGIPLDRIRVLANDGVGEADAIDSVLKALARLSGFTYMKHMITCRELSPEEMTAYQQNRAPPISYERVYRLIGYALFYSYVCPSM